MRRFTSFAAILVMLCMMVPALACVAAPMTTAGQDCCQQMRGRCGAAATQGCCQVSVRNSVQQLPSRVMTEASVPVRTVAIVYSPAVDLFSASGYAWRRPEEHSPPGLVVASTIILRI